MFEVSVRESGGRKADDSESGVRRKEQVQSTHRV